MPFTPSSLLVTGAAGFIGSAFCRHALETQNVRIIGFDKLTYAAAPGTVEALCALPGFTLRRGDLADPQALRAAFEDAQPDAVVHLAAETHVDRSIDAPDAFIETNLVGTFKLLEAARAYRDNMPASRAGAFRFLHVSTDEVYGTLGKDGLFSETTPYAPNSPYAASKAGADHLVRAWHQTYGLPVITTNCSNNYGPYQFPEKLLPRMILNAFAGQPLPVYGEGRQVRDWLFVTDHARALWTALTMGKAGEKYNIGGCAEIANIDLVRKLCAHLDLCFPDHAPHERLIAFVPDRPGHDFRYALDARKIERDLGFAPQVTLDDGLKQTIAWYHANAAWLRTITTYRGERLGLGRKQGGQE